MLNEHVGKYSARQDLRKLELTLTLTPTLSPEERETTCAPHAAFHASRASCAFMLPRDQTARIIRDTPPCQNAPGIPLRGYLPGLSVTAFTTFSKGSPRTAARAMRAEVVRISCFASTLQNAA